MLSSFGVDIMHVTSLIQPDTFVTLVGWSIAELASTSLLPTLYRGPRAHLLAALSRLS